MKVIVFIVLPNCRKTGGRSRRLACSNVTAHAPYMHDGSVSTSRPSLDYYDRGGNRSKEKSPFIYKIGLATREKRDLLELLQTLNEPDDHPKQP